MPETVGPQALHGQALVPEVVLGQVQGGFAMGVGYALLESLPPFEGGPGNGQWNLGQYLVARGSDLPLRDVEIEMLPPLTPDEPPKGMAEVVMIPIVPALLNAIHDAIGHRFPMLPVTQDMLVGQAGQLEQFHWFVRAHLEDSSGSLATSGARTEQQAAARARKK